MTSLREHLLRQSDRYVRMRLSVFLAGVVFSAAAYLAFGPLPFWFVAVAAIVGFGGAVYAHRRVNAVLAKTTPWLRYQSAQVARARLDWEHIPQAPVDAIDRQHPFAVDLDLLNERSVHQLISTATTAEGTQRLADWLTATQPDTGTIAHRQQLVCELARLPHFCKGLVLHAQVDTDGEALPWHTSVLLAGLPKTAPNSVQRATLLGAIALTALTAVLLALNARGVLPAPVWVVPWVLYLLLFVSNTAAIHQLFERALDAQVSLRKLRAVFTFLERWPYGETPALRALCAPFLDPAHQPSTLLRRFSRVLAGASLQQNIFIWLPVNLVVPWDMLFAYLLRGCEADLRFRLPAWLDAWHELEALCSMANFAYLNPSTSMPQIRTAAGKGGVGDGSAASVGHPAFQAQALAHPLIPDSVRVSNDYTLTSPGDVALVTGSNMSGKSSFLRTLGVNLCLAYAGAPVCAAHMETRLFRLYTCIAVSDSVVDGISYFYAEVKRLKRLMDALRADDPLPLFFLIDEIFKGTNNRERLIGSRSYIRALAGHNGLGVISTHDLELTHLSEEIPQLTNYHFREHLEQDQLVFDFQLRPGPSPSTNALRIMQREGLPVTL